LALQENLESLEVVFVFRILIPKHQRKIEPIREPSQMRLKFTVGLILSEELGEKIGQVSSL
jgi:hypothetical protein